MTYEEAQGKALPVDGGTIDAIHAALPPFTRVWPFERGGQLYLGADLLSDCGPGGTYEAAAAHLLALAVVRLDDAEDD